VNKAEVVDGVVEVVEVDHGEETVGVEMEADGEAMGVEVSFVM
jgi:hypothetical protein